MSNFKIGQLVKIGSESSANILPNSGIGYIAEDWSQPSCQNYNVLILWCESYVHDIVGVIGDDRLAGFLDYELSPL